jgi:hypothetical protein
MPGGGSQERITLGRRGESMAALSIFSPNQTKNMKHRNLFPVDTRNAVLPEHYDQLQAWIERLPSLFNNASVSAPTATLLCGIPGVGKGTAAGIIARTLNRPLFLLDGSIPLTDLDSQADGNEPFVLWIDQPGQEHAGIIRWIQDAELGKAFVVFSTDEPHRLPAVFTRADVVSSIWHMELPTLNQRSALFGELLSSRIAGHHTHDSVKLGQLSGLFTPAEIHAAYDRACQECGGVPKPGALIDVVLALKPLALRMDAELACLRAWAHEHALAAVSASDKARL